MSHSPTTDLVNAGGGLIALAVGVGILALARGERRAVAMGGYAACFGFLYVVENVFHPGSAASVAIAGAAFATTAFGLVLAAVVAPRPLGRRGIAVLALALVAGVTPAAATLADPAIAAANFSAHPSPLLSVTTAAMQLVKATGFVVAGAAALAYRATHPEAMRERRALLALALAIGLFAEFQAASIDLWNAYSAGAPLLLAHGLVLGPALVLLFAPTQGMPEPRLARRALLGLAAAGVAGAFHSIALVEIGDGYGASGVGRTVASALLVLAIVRYDLLGVPLPRLAVRRGPLAAGALALLFIVAQIAQNFLSAQYGLLVGGVVAGAFLFAAQPIQRAIERVAGSANSRPADDAASAASAHAQESYRKALRLALHDGALSAEEERQLADLAEHLGLAPREMTRLKHEVEREVEGSAGAQGVA